MENIEFLEPLHELLENLVSKYGALGIAAAMFAESAGVPFASSIVLLTAGSMILRGTSSFWTVFIASTLGITTGSIFSYMLGLMGSVVSSAVKIGHSRGLRFSDNGTSIKPRSKTMSFWDRYGNFSIFMAQLWGVTRTFISFPAGAMHMNIYLFIIYTFLGGAIFSLMTIGLSIILTSTMSLIILILKDLAELSPWLLSIPVILVIIIIYWYGNKGKMIKK